jgi:putative ABC transport system permease protein
VLKLRVVGVRAEGSGGEAAGGGLYVSVNTARAALRATTDGDLAYSSLVVTAETPARAVQLLDEFSLTGFGAVALKKEVDQVTATFGMVRLVLLVVGGIAIVVAALGVANTMLMAVLERTREIGILRSIGATSGYVRAQFLTEAALLGACGSMLGAVVGFISAAAVEPLLRAQLEALSGHLSSGALFVVTPQLVATALLGGSMISILAAWPASERAARLEPASSLRYE